MFAERPPTVVVGLLEVLLWTVEEGDIRLHPVPCLCVGNGLLDILVLHVVEEVHVVLVVLIAQEGVMCVVIVG